MRHLILFLVFLIASGAHAAPSATVEVVQSPAWLDQGGRRVAVAPGAAMDSEARLVTGAQARLVIRLAEGSTVKLGENTRFSFRHAPESSLYKAALNVLVGAFRFTTTALGQGYRRDIRATVGTATIGIRGTDVWGKAADDRDFVVLIEGSIDIEREGQNVTMSTPQTIFN
ncbi:MAG: FecR family protein, partial [Gammaproteobacteria bacterium]